VEDGNHSLEVAARTLRATGTTQDAVEADVLAAVSAFLAAHA
jgi:hypothetical protein